MIDKSKSSLNNLFYQNSKFKNKFLIDPILGNDIDFSSIQLVKKSIIELDLEKIFTITTTEIFYKDSIFYQKSKITLEPTRLLSYSLEEIKGKSRLLFVLDFCNLTIEIAVKKRQKKFRILILGSEKVFRFKTINYELFQIFLMYLNYFLTNSQSKKDNLLHLSILPNYYKVIHNIIKSFYINERTLTHYAKSGDLLLFKGLGYKSAFQRLILRSDYGKFILINRIK